MQTQVFNQHIMEHFAFILDINDFHRFTFFLNVPSNSSYLRASLLSHGNGVVFYVFFFCILQVYRFSHLQGSLFLQNNGAFFMLLLFVTLGVACNSYMATLL